MCPVSQHPDHETQLRREIRELGTLLGQTIVRQEGDGLFNLVEEVRQSVRTDPASAARRINGTDVETATKLARAFSIYFDLANIAEQVERSRDVRANRAQTGGPLEQVATAVVAAGIDPDIVAHLVTELAVRPVFTAHPTEAVRRTVLLKLRRIADLLLADGLAEDERRARLAELVEVLWQTDELRLAQPHVLDEARNALYYLDDLARGPLTDVLSDLARALRRMGTDLPPYSRPLTFGSWIGGDRDGNPFVTPDVTRQVLTFQREHAIADLQPMIVRLAEDDRDVQVRLDDVRELAR